MGLGISPLKCKIVLESNPLKSTMLVGRFGLTQLLGGGGDGKAATSHGLVTANFQTKNL